MKCLLPKTTIQFQDYVATTLNEKRVKDGLDALNDDEEMMIEDNINELLNLSDYVLPTLEIKAIANEEEVADIFVRVNSGGQKLTEKNFIETLLAVYDNDLHMRINQFCKDSRIPKDGTSYNHNYRGRPCAYHSHNSRISFQTCKIEICLYAIERQRLEHAQIICRNAAREPRKVS